MLRLLSRVQSPRDLYRQLQTIADDLSVFEQALLLLTADLVQTPVSLPELPSMPAPPVPPALRLPGLPRCVGVSKPCWEPANAPLGMCIRHFIHTFGHKYANSRKYVGDHGEYTCELCGLSWPVALTYTPRQKVEGYKREALAAIRTRCPKRVLTDRAKAILEASGTGVV